MKKIIIGTSEQNLAIAQSNMAKKELEALDFEVELKSLKSNLLSNELLNGSIDMCVHSLSNISTAQTDGLKITALSRREDPADWLIINKNATADNQILKLKENAIIGFTSTLRKVQLLDFRADLQFKNASSDLSSQLTQLEKGDFDAIVLAACELIRLEIDLSKFIVIKLNPKEFVPTVAQGILAYQTRTDDLETRRLLKNIHHKVVAELSNIERKVLQKIDTERNIQLGVFCEMDQLENFHVWAVCVNKEGIVSRIRLSSSTSFQFAEKIVESLNNSFSD